MNLTYIKNKVNKYTTLQAFFADVALMIANAVKYNSDPGNPYRHAAEEMKKRHDKIVKRVWQQIQQRQQAQKS
jgi:delta-aminolevulinic acid dehydratase/porphobilinogen synthase